MIKASEAAPTVDPNEAEHFGRLADSDPGWRSSAQSRHTAEYCGAGLRMSRCCGADIQKWRRRQGRLAGALRFEAGLEVRQPQPPERPQLLDRIRVRKRLLLERHLRLGRALRREARGDPRAVPPVEVRS